MEPQEAQLGIHSGEALPEALGSPGSVTGHSMKPGRVGRSSRRLLESIQQDVCHCSLGLLSPELFTNHVDESPSLG
jgi:hypothetical protein